MQKAYTLFYLVFLKVVLVNIEKYNKKQDTCLLKKYNKMYTKVH